MVGGAVAAGHPETVRAGVEVLRGGGNAVDAAVAAVCASFAAEPLLTGLGAGGYMLVVLPGGRPTLLDFFVEAPGRGVPAGAPPPPLTPIDVSFGDAVQLFHAGAGSVGTYGTPAGLAVACDRHGTLPLSELVRPAIALARRGVPLSAQQAYVLEILAGIVTATPEGAALFAPRGGLLREGDVLRDAALAEGLERLGSEGAEPFYTGDIASAAAAWVAERGGRLGLDDLAAYAVVERDPIAASFRDRTVLLNPPPSAGGVLIAHALRALGAGGSRPSPETLVAAMEDAQDQRTPDFLEGLAEEGFLERFLAGRLGSTTHVSVLDAAGGAASVTCSNGEGSGLVVPGTGLHLNNVMGEEDLNPHGFHRHAPGRRMPSMMAPTVVLDGTGLAELVVGSGGSNRIRSAVLQTIVNLVDRGMDLRAAVDAPRLHVEAGTLYHEPGVELPLGVRALAPFRAPNLFFGGVNAVRRDAEGVFTGAGDPRRGGAAGVL